MAAKKAATPRQQPPKVEIAIERSVMIPARDADANANERLGKEEKIKLIRKGNGLVEARRHYKNHYNDWNDCDESRYVFKLEHLKEAVAALEAESA